MRDARAGSNKLPQPSTGQNQNCSEKLYCASFRLRCFRPWQPSTRSRPTLAHRPLKKLRMEMRGVELPQTKHFIHDVNQLPLRHSGGNLDKVSRGALLRKDGWWRQTGSNRRPEACKATALPTELCPQFNDIQQKMVGLGRFELPTSRLSSARSNQLSYRP